MKELNKRMYFRAKPATLETARLLRKQMTKSEELLWERLRGKQLLGQRFRRQHPIDIFIVDFFCHDARLIIELDGEIHKERVEYDDGREAEIERYNLKVIRFSNHEVLNEIEKVVEIITSVVKERLSSPPPGDLGVNN